MGGLDNLLDPKAKDQDSLMLLKYAKEANKFDILMENQHLIKTPIVRNGNKVTVGYDVDTWKKWEAEV